MSDTVADRVRRHVGRHAARYLPLKGLTAYMSADLIVGLVAAPGHEPTVVDVPRIDRSTRPAIRRHGSKGRLLAAALDLPALFTLAALTERIALPWQALALDELHDAGMLATIETGEMRLTTLGRRTAQAIRRGR